MLESSLALPIAAAKAVVFSFTVVRSALPPLPPDAVFSLIAVKRPRTVVSVAVGSIVLFPIALRILLRYDLTVPPLGVDAASDEGHDKYAEMIRSLVWQTPTEDFTTAQGAAFSGQISV